MNDIVLRQALLKLVDYILQGNITGGDASEATLQALLAELQNKADLTETQPVNITNGDITAKYAISRDDTSTTTEYYGFVSSSGSWYILRIDTTTGVYLYANGNSDFLTNWGSRTSLTYDEFNNLTW